MIAVGITGTIASGKSTTLGMFAEEGVPVFSADEAVHALYRGRAVPLVAEVFPDAIVDGIVDRPILGRIIGRDPALLARLEAIVHPLVREEEERFRAAALTDGAAIVAIEHPLIFEKGDEGRFDVVVATSAPEDLRRERAASRGMAPETFDRLDARQLPDAAKREKADFVVDSSRGLDEARRAVRHILESIASRPD